MKIKIHNKIMDTVDQYELETLLEKALFKSYSALKAKIDLYEFILRHNGLGDEVGVNDVELEKLGKKEINC